MSFPQQSRSDMAALEADQRRRDLDAHAQTHPNEASLDRSPQTPGLGAKLRAWIHALFRR
jgi:hypothetical protein